MKIVINPIRPALCEAAQDFHLLVRLQSEPVAGFKRTPLNLVLVVDRSGSMQGSKLAQAKRCVIDLVQRMSPTDQVGVVQYDDAVDTVMPLSQVEQVGACSRRWCRASPPMAAPTCTLAGCEAARCWRLTRGATPPAM